MTTKLESLISKLDSRLERHGPIWVVYPDEWKEISRAMKAGIEWLKSDDWARTDAGNGLVQYAADEEATHAREAFRKALGEAP